MIDPNDEPDAHPRHRANGHGRRVTDLADEPLVPQGDGVLLEPRALLVPPPAGAVLHPPAEAAAPPWTVAATLGELRMVVRMYFDPRYRVSRLTQFAVPAMVLLFVLNYFFFALWFPVPVLSPVLERVFCVLLGILLYKLLAREVCRYREVLAYLTRHGFQ